MELIFMAIVTYVGIIACVGVVSAAYKAGGFLGIVCLIACVIFCLWLVSVICGGDND